MLCVCIITPWITFKMLCEPTGDRLHSAFYVHVYIVNLTFIDIKQDHFFIQQTWYMSSWFISIYSLHLSIYLSIYLSIVMVVCFFCQSTIQSVISALVFVICNSLKWFQWMFQIDSALSMDSYSTHHWTSLHILLYDSLSHSCHMMGNWP